MNQFDIPIETLIPQRPPMVMIHHIHHCDRRHTQTSYTVTSNSFFVKDDCLSAVGLIENMAQTVAARMGYLALHGPEKTGIVRVGVIGAIRNLSIEKLPVLGNVLFTSVDLVEEMGDMIMVMAKAANEETLFAHCELIVSLI